MTQVLLITDTERVQRVFESLQGKGVLQLRTVPTLVKGDEEISAAAPDYLFLQSRVSGFSGEIAARHLQKSLSSHTKLILLTVDDEDAAQAKKHGKPYLSLAVEDQELSEGIAAMLQGLPAPKKVAPPPAPPAEPAVAPAAAVPAAAPKPRGANGKAVAWLPPTIGQEPEPEKTELPPPPSIEVEEIVELSTPRPPEQRRELPHPEAELEHEEPPPYGEPAAEKTWGGRSFADLIERASANEPAPVSKAPEQEEWVGAGAPDGFADKGAPEPFRDHSVETVAALIDAEELASLHRKEKKHKRWVIPAALALAFIPLIYFVVVSQNASKQAAVRAPAPVAAPKPARPAPPVAAPPAAKPAPAAVPKVPAPTAPTAPPKAGLKALPPLLAGVRVDPSYSKEHPGWQRFVGSRAEYRLFKQGELYRAMQVLAQKRQSIPEELFKKVLLEFGGAEGYLLESREKKGPYLIERGETKGNLALTIYRNNKDLAVKGLVLYYR